MTLPSWSRNHCIKQSIISSTESISVKSSYGNIVKPKINLDNADQICTAENIYVKSSYRDKIIIVKPKMQVKYVPLKH